jgi:hypothetical protein
MGHTALTNDAALVGRWASLGGNNITNSVAGKPTPTWNGTGAYLPKPAGVPVAGASFDLSGSNYINCGNLAVTGNQVTYCGWVYDENASGGSDPIFYDRTSNCGLHTSTDAARWGYTWNGLGFGWLGGPLRVINEWVFISLTISDSTFRARIRVKTLNGTTTTGETVAGFPSVAYAPDLKIGADTILGDRRFVGNLNDLRMYSRVLSDADLDTIWAATNNFDKRLARGLSWGNTLARNLGA